MNKNQVSQVLNEIGTLLELKGENPFKSRAYYNGARMIEMLNEDLAALVSSGRIKDLKGIGTALAEKIYLLAKSRNLRKKIGNAARYRAKKMFEIKDKVKQIEMLYYEVL